jgi:ATP-dependent exoDNAse (exonuclease V) beta subunit
MNAPAPPTELPRELVLASAGSGKTYHLSSRIIELLASGAPPSEVLASTFTRKAAGEILDRVLVRLAEGASDADRARDLGRDAHPSLADPAECRALLARLLTDLHQMNVGTLDAFFIRVARSFFQEMGLAPGWTLTDKPTEDRLRTEAVQAVLAEADKDDLLEILRMINRGSANRTVHDDLGKKLTHLVRIRRQLDPGAVDPWRPTYPVAEQLTPAEVEVDARALADRLRAAEVPNTKTGTPVKRWVTDRESGATAIAALDWVSLLGKGVGLKVMEQEDTYDGHRITADFGDIYERATTLARIDLARQLVRECEALGRLAELLGTAFEDAQRRMASYRFEDITYLLGGPDAAGSRDDLHYRLDQQVRHILLDEFQDTSLEQWRALSPIADELLSGHLAERAGVIVADPKQCIYGWRGARPELVHQVGRMYGLKGDPMETSWRSSEVLVDFVADVFRGLPSNAVVSELDVGPKVASAWMQDFTELKAAKDVPGYVSVHLAPGIDGRKAVQPLLLSHAAAVIRGLHEQMPARSIGVLVRRNKVLSYLMNELHSLGVDASGEGGTPLTDTPPVNALLSLLQLADHPRSGAARYHVACSPLGTVVEFTDHRDEGGARALANRVRRRLLADGYGPALAVWVQDLAPHCDRREVLRLLQLVELGHRWDDRPTLRPGDFTRYVARESVEDPSSSPVKVMTVHRSKGLEFDIVVLPELYASLSPKDRGVAIPQRDPRTGQVVQVHARLKKELQPLFPEIEGPHGELQAAGLRDDLSVLYVALTRAKYALHLMLPAEGDSGKHSAGLIRSALGLADGGAVDGDLLLERGDERWSEQLGDEPVTAEPIPEDEPTERDGPLLRPSAKGPGRNLARRSPSSMEGGSGVDLAFHMKLDAGPALERGSVVHAWCEQITWIEDGFPDDDALHAAARAVAPGMDGKSVTSLVREFRGWLEVAEVRQALSREKHEGDSGTTVRVENELPFVRRIGVEIQEGFIDRLVLVERNGRVVAGEVLDFKTDRLAADDEAGLMERVKHYRPQIEEYCEVVRERYGLGERDVRGTLVFLESGVLRGVG